LIVAAGSVALAGCMGALSKSPPEKQRYFLTVERPEGTGQKGRGLLRVHRVRVSPVFERKGFVYRTGESTFEHDFYNEFFSAPTVMLRRVTTEWLGASNVFAGVISAREPGDPDWVLEARASRLYADIRESDSPVAVLHMEFAVINARSPKLAVVFEKQYRTNIPTARASPEAFVEGWTEGLTQILTGLEADLRKSFGRRRR
jgi:ABC-type uncharacterized transport system auxiliary subunit